jgi:4-hydroxymandelate synthase
MKIFDIDHVEWYVADSRRAAERLCAGYGFRVYGHGDPGTGLPGQRSVLLGQGDIRILLTEALDPGHPAAGFVERHGDGVAVIAFGAADAEAAGTAAAEWRDRWDRDRSVRIAEVPGFGDVVHRLVERRCPREDFWPGAIEMVPDAARGAQDDLLRLIDHAAVCVPTGQLDPTVHFYDRYGFAVIFEEYIEVGGQGMASKVVQSPSGGVTFTILEPDPVRRRGQVDDFLEWHGGAGVQHLAFLTHDIVRAVRTICGRGVEFAQTPDTYYAALGRRLGTPDIAVDALRPLGVLVDRDHWGQMYQIFAKSTHERRTFFFELIDRHGARTFGTSNIPALYAAKECELAEVRGEGRAPGEGDGHAGQVRIVAGGTGTPAVE